MLLSFSPSVFCLNLPVLPSSAIPTSSTPNPQIKHFLEDNSDDAELSKFVKDFPGSEPYHPAESKTRASRPQILEPRPQSPDLCDDDVEFRATLWPQPSDSQQYFCPPAPLSPSSRPRSPWGKLDPYDSSEVETPALPLPLSGWVLKDLGRAEREPGVGVWACVHSMCQEDLSVLQQPRLSGFYLEGIGNSK